MKVMRMRIALLMGIILAAPGAWAQEGAASLLENGSFEGGTRYWFNLKDTTLVLRDAAQGEYALSINKGYVQSAAFELQPGKAVTISFAARAVSGTEAAMGWQCTPCSREAGQKYKQTWGLKQAHPVKIGGAWKRYAFTFTPSAAQTGLWPRPTYMLQLGDCTKPVLIDAVSVAYGAGTQTYAPRRPVEVQIDCPDLKGFADPSANILEKGATVTLTGAAANPGAQPRRVTLRWQLFDYEGTRPAGAAVEKQVTIEPGKVASEQVKMKLAASGTVLARLSAIGDSKTIDSSDIPLTTLPHPMAATRPDPRERFGGSIWGDHIAHQHQKIGMGWVRWYPHVNWSRTQPDGPDSWVWEDKTLDALAARGISAHAVLYSKPKWAFADPKKDNLPRDMQWPVGDPRWDDLTPQCAWDRYVTNLVKHYAGRSLVYEIENEPELDHWDKIKDLYVKFTIRTARLIKQADPQARVMVDNVYGIPSGLNRTLLERGGGKYIDIISWHDYHEGWLADATAMKRMRNNLEALGCGHIEIWFNEGWAYTNTAVDEPDVALTHLTAAQSTNAMLDSVAELTATGQDKTILFHTGYEDHGMSFWDYCGPGTMLWDFYDYPLPLAPAWNMLCFHIGLSERVAFIRPPGANCCIFQDLRNGRGVVVAYTDRDAKEDVQLKLPVAGLEGEDAMGNPLAIEDGTVVLSKTGRPVFLFTKDHAPGKALTEAVAPLDRKHSGFVDQGGARWRLPLAWEGEEQGTARGNPISAGGKPVWRLDQVWPDDPIYAENYTPMPWNGTAWFPKENTAGGQPEARVENGAVRLSVRAPWGGEKKTGQRIAALVFIAPESGGYTISGTARSKKWTGGAKTFKIGVFKKDTQRAAPLREIEVPSDDTPVPFSFKAELATGHELVFLPLMPQYHNATATTIEGLEIRRE